MMTRSQFLTAFKGHTLTRKLDFTVKTSKKKKRKEFSLFCHDVSFEGFTISYLPLKFLHTFLKGIL